MFVSVVALHTDTRTHMQRGAKPFEWYSDWRQLRPLFRVAVAAGSSPPPHGGRLLVVGCGNSELSAQLYDDGFTNIVNIDFSKVRAWGVTPPHGAALLVPDTPALLAPRYASPRRCGSTCVPGQP